MVNVGADSLGALAGAGVGLAFGPPGVLAGAAAGPALARALSWVGGEIRSRLLSSKEKLRIGSALVIAMGRIEQRRQAGEEPRRDGLFEPGEDPEGLLEGSLLAAARSYEERKVPFLGAFYSSFVFEEEVPPAMAHYLLRLLNRLTYRQLCALAYLADPARRDERQRIQAEAEEEGCRTSPTLSAELNDLANLSLVGYEQDDGTVANPLATWGSTPIDASAISRTGPTELGETLLRMAELSKIPREDQEQIAAALAGKGG